MSSSPFINHLRSELRVQGHSMKLVGCVWRCSFITYNRFVLSAR